MLTPRQNLHEVMTGGKPDRFVKQYEFIDKMIFDPIFLGTGGPMKGQENIPNAWGFYASWKEEWPGQMTIHNPPEMILVKDIEEWQDYIKQEPKLDYSDAEWEYAVAQAESINREEEYVCAVQIPGIFEMSHHMAEIKNVLMAFYECPDEYKDFLKYIADYEIRKAERIVEKIHPDALFHHDDWGSQISTFISPDMFEEFLLPVYKEVYGWWKQNGVELIVHHSDSYGATLVPFMIDMGIDIWQGVMNTNNIPELIEKYGGQITFMGGIDSATVDYPGWTKEVIREEVRKACDANGPLYYIPCASQGGNYSTFDGVYQTIQEELDEYSPIYWKEHGLA